MAQLSDATLPSLAPPKARNNLLALWIGVVIFAAMSLWMAIVSKGFLEMDAQTHFMFARHGFREAHYLTNIWGRPLCTGLNLIPALLGGVLGVRVMSLLLAIGTGLVTYRIAQGQNYRLPAMATILLFAQPLFYLHSFSELTEIPFAFVMILGFWAYQSKHFLTMAILIAITPSGRPEGFFLIAMAAVALLVHGRWYYLFVLPIPMLIWSFFGWVTFGRPADQHWFLWLKINWPYSMESAYGRGPWYSFLVQLPVLLSPIVFPTIIFGVYVSLREALRRGTGRLPAFLVDHRARCQLMMVFIPLFILVVHSILRTFGLMGSNGELRYLLCVAPLWALLCAKGWEWAWARFRLPAPFLCAALAASAPIYANCFYRVVPLRIYESDLLGQAVSDWYKKTPGLEAAYPRMMASLPSVYFDLDVSQTDVKHGETWGLANVNKKPDGVILIWDKNALANASKTMIVTQEQVDAAGWIWIGNIVYGNEWCNVYLSPRTIIGAPTIRNGSTHYEGFTTPGTLQ
jgi:hypothetical protein